jgi:hypothetical protein
MDNQHKCGGMHGGPEGRRNAEEEKNHLDQTAELWEKAFWQALHEARVELLKEEIKKVWGPSLTGTAAGVAASMHDEWKAFWARKKDLLASPEHEAHDRIVDLVREDLKRLT